MPRKFYGKEQMYRGGQLGNRRFGSDKEMDPKGDVRQLTERGCQVQSQDMSEAVTGWLAAINR